MSQANSKQFFCFTDSLSLTNLGTKICDYAECSIGIDAPVISVNGNSVTITPATIRIRFVAGSVWGLPNGVQPRESPRPDFTIVVPTTVYYE